jgi:ABC-type sugar transport system ATPase subunit
MVFQNHVLYPHLTVFGNLAFGLRLRGLKRAEMDRRVAEAAELLGLADLLRRKPGELSGGQRQRVALGRAIVRRPRLFLFDEPLSNLDAALRGQLRDEIRRLHRRLAATMLYVTHDQAEALALGQRIAVLCAGRLRQVGPPLEVFGRPADAAVAALFGGAQTHTGRLERRGATTVFVAADLCVPLPAEHPAAAAAEQPPGRPATLGLQAGAIVLFDPATRQTL